MLDLVNLLPVTVLALAHTVLTIITTGVVNFKILKGWEAEIGPWSTRQWMSWVVAALIGLASVYIPKIFGIDAIGALGNVDTGTLFGDSFFVGLLSNLFYKIKFVANKLGLKPNK